MPLVLPVCCAHCRYEWAVEGPADEQVLRCQACGRMSVLRMPRGIVPWTQRVPFGADPLSPERLAQTGETIRELCAMVDPCQADPEIVADVLRDLAEFLPNVGGQALLQGLDGVDDPAVVLPPGLRPDTLTAEGASGIRRIADSSAPGATGREMPDADPAALTAGSSSSPDIPPKSTSPTPPR